ncbi:unnamed protein product [Pleuronectes platessa]|uniref:Uncharacterized protein n=1 Tax=Pleuronectes platessa TaxID=8262 RepID=A0A9N7W142_PLEPL|nr:unnamed protein product [Pleuronectes platessa]
MRAESSAFWGLICVHALVHSDHVRTVRVDLEIHFMDLLHVLVHEVKPRRQDAVLWRPGVRTRPTYLSRDSARGSTCGPSAVMVWTGRPQVLCS